ncbi:hypothetical protein HDV00_000071 [Rhizophlyctis rosea]|nr:hypothetical protein HDV00_000071 [Rhizophlyctis rosea]
MTDVKQLSVDRLYAPEFGMRRRGGVDLVRSASAQTDQTFPPHNYPNALPMKRTRTSTSDRSVASSFFALLKPYRAHKGVHHPVTSDGVTVGSSGGRTYEECVCGHNDGLTVSSVDGVGGSDGRRSQDVMVAPCCAAEVEVGRRVKKRKGRNVVRMDGVGAHSSEAHYFTWAGRLVARFGKGRKEIEGSGEHDSSVDVTERDGKGKAKQRDVYAITVERPDEDMLENFDDRNTIERNRKRLSSEHLTAREFAQMTRINVLYRTDEEEEREGNSEHGGRKRGLSFGASSADANMGSSIHSGEEKRTSIFDPGFWTPPTPESVRDTPARIDETIEEEDVSMHDSSTPRPPSPVPSATLSSNSSSQSPSAPRTSTSSSSSGPSVSHSPSSKPTHRPITSPLRTSLSSIHTHHSSSTATLATPTETKVHKVGRFTVIVEPNPLAVDAQYMELVRRAGGDVVEENPELSRFRRESLEE